MRILLLHNTYQLAGGEDAVVAAELELLQQAGHAVELYQVSNQSVRGSVQQATAAWNAVYSRRSRRLVTAAIARFRPEIVHVHNFFPLLSPSVYDACRSAAVPVVQTLHNYRLMCSNGLLFRDGQPCETCVGRTMPWPGILRRCYRHSLAGSTVVAGMLAVHHRRRTWQDRVDVFIALTEFSRQKFIAAGLPPSKIVIKPHFVRSDPGQGTGGGGYALFVGRLAEEKGVSVLLEAWKTLGDRLPLKIAGEGPLEEFARSQAVRGKGIEVLGRLTRVQSAALMQRAEMLVVPSICYETFGLVIIEAFAAGLPVVASDLGSLAVLVDSGRTGRHFKPGSPAALVAEVEWMLANPTAVQQMRQEARREFESKYTAEQNRELLTSVYRQAIELYTPSR